MNDAAARRLLLVDDDELFCEVLAEALARRGYRVDVSHDAEGALAQARNTPPDYALVDLRMPGPSGLTLIRALIAINPAVRIVILTGYASIATAVEAIKLGAVHYLTKPAGVEDILAVLRENADEVTGTAAPVAAHRPSPERLEWEYLQKVLQEHDGNISATARSLGMHRRTLQRKLTKRPVRH
ncbi:MAG: response regulator transcription factor [Gammaproteobacteria bacterium]|nr:response regulator transcription factor [Gammaproteobacteria bacterium]